MFFNFDSIKGVIGHECINEIIVDRLLTILGVEQLSYELINADIEIEDQICFVTALRKYQYYENTNKYRKLRPLSLGGACCIT